MVFTQESSDLIEMAEEMATNQFEEQTDLGTLVLDVFQQFLATTAGLLGSALLDKGPFGFMLGYLGVSILFQTAKILEQENYFAHRTFRLDGSSGEKVLGDKFWFDDMYGDVMPITIFGSFGGVYAPVYGDTKEFSYSADIIVREFNFEESKASSLTTSYSYPKLDYWLSTRNLAGYSDFDDYLVVGYLQSTGAINPLVDNIGIPEFNHAKSSVYYIENQIQEDTADNRDTYLDTIIPTIDYDSERDRFAPRYSFIDSMGGIPAPEFYTEYPVFVSDDSSAADQYGSIYKIMEIENPEEITSIEIQLFDTESNLQADIVSIDAYVVWSVTPNTFGAGTQTANSHLVTLENGEFDVDLSTGIITIGSVQTLSTILNSYATKEEELDEDKLTYSVSQPKILFEIKVEKYRSISDVRDLTSEQVNKIATAQAIEAAILEYNYQFNLATQTQMGFHELIYTAIVTAISTALTMGFSAGMGSIVNSLKDSASEVSSKVLGRLLETFLGAAKSFSVATVIGAVTKEMGQELLLDPWIESTVSGLVRRAGGDAIMQMVLSSIAESGREAISGPLSTMFSSEQTQQQSLSEILDTNYFSKDKRPTIQEFINEFNDYSSNFDSQQTAKESQMAILRGANKILSFVSLATGFAASFLLGPFGALAFTTIATYCLTEDISVKKVFSKIFNPVKVAISGIAGKVGDGIQNTKEFIVKNLGIGVGIATFGTMTTFLTLSLGPLGFFCGLTFSGLSMFGMVRTKPSSLLKQPSKRVSHYYAEIGACRYDNKEHKQFVRHNFEFEGKTKSLVRLINDKDTIRYKCKHCGHIIDHNLENTILLKKMKAIRNLHEDYSAGTRYIYRIYWNKYNKKLTDTQGSDFIPFPDLMYVGETGRVSPILRYEEHLERAFTNPRSYIEQLISEYTENIEEAKKVFRFEILQVITFQGDMNEINRIVDSVERKEALRIAEARTRELADFAEIAWIGLFHSQYQEFGANIHMGGRIGSKSGTIIPFIDLHNNFKKIACLAFGKQLYIELVQESFKSKFSRTLLDRNLEEQYPEQKTFKKILRGYQKELIYNYFEKGYQLYEIVRILDLSAKKIDPGLSGINKKLVSQLLKEKVEEEFEIDIPLAHIGDYRGLVIKARVERFISSINHRVHNRDLLPILPGFTDVKTLTKFNVRQGISLNELNDRYYPDSIYWGRAVDILRKEGYSITCYDFLIKLGFGEEYSDLSLRRDYSGVIKTRFRGLTFTELKDLIIENILPTRFEEDRETFKALVSSRPDKHYYLTLALSLIRSSPYEYNAYSLLVALGGLGYSESTIKKLSDKCLLRTLGYNFNRLRALALSNNLNL